jgi:hypothetical protein
MKYNVLITKTEKKQKKVITWSAFTRSHRGGRSVKMPFIVNSGGFALLKNECFSNFSAVGLFV